MIIGIEGMGLIGGSCAKALKKYTSHTVLVSDKNTDVIKAAAENGACDGELCSNDIGRCDIIIIALYPDDTVRFVDSIKDKVGENAVVTDFCGIKSRVCRAVEPIVKHKSFTYIGAHPMAGREYSGFARSDADLFRGASLIMTPFAGTPEDKTDFLFETLRPCGFSRPVITDPLSHDKMIAYTSQLAHVVSNAYVKSPAAPLHDGFSAGSYKDLTRVARLNEDMWTQLFSENREALIPEIDGLAQRLMQYSDALKSGDDERLRQLLKEGRETKERIDKDND